MPYQVKVIRDEEGLVALEEGWTTLLGESRAATIFASFPWNMAWWRAIGGGSSLYAVVAEDSDGQIRGIAPLMLRHVGPLRQGETKRAHGGHYLRLGPWTQRNDMKVGSRTVQSLGKSVK